MSLARIVLAFVLSVLPGALAWTGSLRFEGVSMLGLALLPWLAIAGTPGLDRACLAALVCAPWPAWALGAAIDAENGAAWIALAPTLAWSAVFVLALAALAARSTGARYEVAWLALVVVPPLVRFAFDYGVGHEAAPRVVTALARASPLGWACEQAGGWAGEQVGGLPREPHFLPWAPCIALALLALVQRSRRGS